MYGWGALQKLEKCRGMINCPDKKISLCLRENDTEEFNVFKEKQDILQTWVYTPLS